MATTVKRIEAALRRENLRHYVESIERNPQTRGEVVVWAGGSGTPVYSVAEALGLARSIAEREREEQR